MPSTVARTRAASDAGGAWQKKLTLYGFEVDLLSPFNSLLFPLIAAVRAAGKITGRESADDAMPPKPVNSILKAVFGLEAGLIGRLPLPFGVSLVAVLRRPA